MANSRVIGTRAAQIKYRSTGPLSSGKEARKGHVGGGRGEEGGRFPFHAATPRPSFHATMASVPRQRLNTENIGENPTVPLS